MQATTDRSEQELQVDEQLRELEARLTREHEEMSPAVVHEWVERARARFRGARVLAFVPILVERAVLTRLRTEPAGVSPAGLQPSAPA